MKLVRYGEKGRERPGLIEEDGTLRDLSGELPDLDAAAIADGALQRIAELDPASLPKVEGSPRLGPCLTGMSKMVAIGLNYSDHAAEAGRPEPKEPILFMKATTALNGPFDDVIVPRDSLKLDWEIELAVIIGKTARYVETEAALDHVAGYAVINDISERHFQNERSGQWVKGKSADTFAPLGPWFVTADEIPDPQALSLQLSLNGEVQQNGSTADMIFGVRTLVSYISSFMTLLPGDVIATGTPSGVGLGKKPSPVYLQPGDVMELSISGLGAQRQTVRAFPG